MTINIFPIEKDLGLSEKLQASASVIIASDILDDKNLKFTKADNYFANDKIKQYISNMLTSDLALVHGILVSTNWNKNDDVFSPDEVWPARNSPIFKPANMDHKGQESDGANQTIGVIGYSGPVNEDYEPIDPDPSQLPQLYHLLVGIYLWERYWPTYINNIKNGIADNSMYISMECFFQDFGYALRLPGSDNVSLLIRNNDTAWLSQFLRVYDGKGTVKIDNKDYQIGRWLKNLTFSGVGFVKRPGNPDSILFNDFISHAKANLIFNNNQTLLETILNKKFDILNHNCVLNINQGKISLWPT